MRDADHLLLNGIIFVFLGGFLFKNHFLAFDEVLVLGAGFAFGSLFLSPDLDLNRGSRAQKRWGIFRVFWLPYAWLFAHRGVSHMPVLGTVTRIVYFGLVAWGTAVLLGSVGVRISFEPQVLFTEKGLLFLAGIFASSFAHYLGDRIRV